MNKLQRAVIGAGLAVVALMVLFPPTFGEFNDGYEFLLRPGRLHFNFPKLWMQLGLVAVLTVAAVAIAGWPRRSE